MSQIFWHSDPVDPGAALVQSKNTIGLGQADDRDETFISDIRRNKGTDFTGCKMIVNIDLII